MLVKMSDPDDKVTVSITGSQSVPHTQASVRVDMEAFNHEVLRPQHVGQVVIFTQHKLLSSRNQFCQQ